jgi:hypothetical protein
MKSFKKLKKEEFIFYFLFLLLPFIFFYPFIKDKVIIGCIDSLNTFFPYYLYLLYSVTNGQLPLWWPYTHLGYPFIEVLQGSVFYIFNYIFIPIFKYDPILAYNLNLIFHIILLEFIVFHYSLFLLNDKKISFLVAILASFSGSFIGFIDFKAFNNSMPWVILALFNLHLFIYKLTNEEKDYFKNIFIYSVSFSLVILVSHPNIIVYFLFYSFLYILTVLLINKKYFGKVLYLWFISIIITVPVWIVQFIIFKEYLPFASRTIFKSNLYNLGSYSLELLITYYLPFIYSKFYIDTFNTEGAASFEVLKYVSVLALPSFFYFLHRFIKNFKDSTFIKKYMFILTLSLSSFILSLGKYTIFYYLIYFFPFYSSIRNPVRNLLFFDFCLAISIGFFLKDFILDSSNNKEKKHILKELFLYFLISFLIFIFISFIFFKLSGLSIYIGKILNIKLYTFLPLLFISIYFFIFYLYYKYHVKIGILLFLLSFLFLIEGKYYFYNIYDKYFKIYNNFDFLKKIYSLDIGLDKIKNKNNLINIYFRDLELETSVNFINLSSILTKTRDINYYEPLSNFEKSFLFNIYQSSIAIDQLWNMIGINIPISAYNVKYLPYIFRLPADKLSVQFDENNIKVLSSFYNVDYKKYLSKVKVFKAFNALYNQNLNNSEILIKYDNKNTANEIIINKNSNIFILIPYDKKSDFSFINFAIKAKKDEKNSDNLFFNFLIKYFQQYIDVIRNSSQGINFGYIDNNRNWIYIDLVPRVVLNNYIDYVIPFSFPKETVVYNGKNYYLFFLNTTDSTNYLINKIYIYFYPSCLSPSFNPNSKLLNTYFKLSDYYLDLGVKKFKVSTLFYNTNAVDFINSVSKIKFYDNIFEFKKKLYLLEFNIKTEALIDKNFIEKIKLYSKINKLSYQNNYNTNTLDTEKLKYILFKNATIYNLNVFKKNNEISFKVRSEGDSFIVINHSYYKYWKGYIDNIEVPVLKVNGIVMGIIVPKGEHKVVLKYEPWYAKFFFVPFFVITIYFIIIMILLNHKN